MRSGPGFGGCRRVILAVLALGLISGHRGVCDEPVKPTRKVKPNPRIEDFAPAEEFVMAGAIKTHYVTRGTSGLPIVLVHGFGSSTYSWEGNLDALAKSNRVYALDVKGFGLTAKPRDGQYHIAEYVRHLVAFLDAMKLDKAVLVGHSMGGAIVTRLALLYPDRVAGLVLVDAAPLDFSPVGTFNAPKPPAADPAKDKDKDQGNAPNRLISALLRTLITRERVEAGLKSAYRDPTRVTPLMVDRYYRPFTIDGAPEALVSMTNPPKLVEPKLPALDSLKMPVLITWGRHDKVVPFALFERYTKSIPGAETMIFEDSGHMPHEEETDAFNVRLVRFLGRCDTFAKPAPNTKNSE